MVEQVARDPDGLAGLRAGRAHARAAAWRVGAHLEGLLVVDVDGTLLDAHSDKQGAAGSYKGGFGFYPLVAFLDPRRRHRRGPGWKSCDRVTPARSSERAPPGYHHPRTAHHQRSDSAS